MMAIRAILTIFLTACTAGPVLAAEADGLPGQVHQGILERAVRDADPAHRDAMCASAGQVVEWWAVVIWYRVQEGDVTRLGVIWEVLAVEAGRGGRKVWCGAGWVEVGYFHGRRLDRETGLYYFRNRYYDPVRGRWLSRDPKGLWGDPNQLGNGYGFVGANAINGLDPWGLEILVKEGYRYVKISNPSELDHEKLRGDFHSLKALALAKALIADRTRGPILVGSWSRFKSVINAIAEGREPNFTGAMLESTPSTFSSDPGKVGAGGGYAPGTGTCSLEEIYAKDRGAFSEFIGLGSMNRGLEYWDKGHIGCALSQFAGAIGIAAGNVVTLGTLSEQITAGRTLWAAERSCLVEYAVQSERALEKAAQLRNSATRLSEGEILAGERYQMTSGRTLRESTHVGEEFVDDLGRTIDVVGDSRASLHWNEKQFLNSIDEHFLKSCDYVLIDLTDFTEAQVGVVRSYLQKLPADRLAKVIRVGF